VQSPFPAALAARGVAPVFSAATYDCTILTGARRGQGEIRRSGEDAGRIQREPPRPEGLFDVRDLRTAAHRREDHPLARGLSNFRIWAGVESGEGTYDVWSYDANGNAVNGEPSAQIRVP